MVFKSELTKRYFRRIDARDTVLVSGTETLLEGNPVCHTVEDRLTDVENRAILSPPLSPSIQRDRKFPFHGQCYAEVPGFG